MGILSRIFGRTETRAAPDYMPAAFAMFGASGYNDSGVTITENNAVICSTVWACVSIISQTIATLPVHVQTRKDGEKQYDHAVQKLLAERPNPYMTPAVFREALLANALLYGAGYAAVVRDGRGVPEALYPLRSDRTRPIRHAGQVVYETRVGNENHYLTPDQVVFILGWSHDGITPLSPVRSGQQAIALSVAMERYAARAFSGGNIGGILQTPPLGDEAMKKFVESWRKNYTGIDNAFKVAVLPDPMKFVPTTLKPQEGQLVEARQAIVLDICRYYRVPPWMVGILEKSSYASLEAQSMAFYQQTVQPWCVKLEQELMAKLLLEAEKPELEIRFNLDAFLRATTTERYSAYQQGRQGGWLSINDIRRKEGLAPVEGGDSYLSPLNMQTVNGQQQPTPPQGNPPPSGADPAAVRELLTATARRIVTKETNAIRRAVRKFQGKPDELRAWADAFYADHAALVTEALTPALRAAGLDVQPEQAAKMHCTESQRLITTALSQKLTADELLDDLQQRAADLVDELLNEGKDHVRPA